MQFAARDFAVASVLFCAISHTAEGLIHRSFETLDVIRFFRNIDQSSRRLCIRVVVIFFLIINKFEPTCDSHYTIIIISDI